jgi:cyclophilin family peptidyl-prolyl cis-trans isomerase
MIQGGDPQGSGMGGTDPTPDELFASDIPGRVVGLSRTRNHSRQFFITETASRHLTAPMRFWQVVKGQELVGKIGRAFREARATSQIRR